MKFEYTRPEDTKLEAYGKVFDIPPKTAPLVDGVNSINKQIAEGNAAQQAAALREGIALFIGEEAAEEIFPKAKLDSINIDEMPVMQDVRANVYSGTYTTTFAVRSRQNAFGFPPLPMKVSSRV